MGGWVYYTLVPCTTPTPGGWLPKKPGGGTPTLREPTHNLTPGYRGYRGTLGVFNLGGGWLLTPPTPQVTFRGGGTGGYPVLYWWVVWWCTLTPPPPLYTQFTGCGGCSGSPYQGGTPHLLKPTTGGYGTLWWGVTGGWGCGYPVVGTLVPRFTGYPIFRGLVPGGIPWGWVPAFNPVRTTPTLHPPRSKRWGIVLGGGNPGGLVGLVRCFFGGGYGTPPWWLKPP